MYLVILPLLFASCVTYNSSSKAKNDVFGKIESLSHSKIPKQIKWKLEELEFFFIWVSSLLQNKYKAVCVEKTLIAKRQEKSYSVLHINEKE